MHRVDRLYGFEFDDNPMVHQQIRAKTFIESQPIVRDRNRVLSFDGEATFPKFMRENNFINRFKKPWAERRVNSESRIEYLL